MNFAPILSTTQAKRIKPSISSVAPLLIAGACLTSFSTQAETPLDRLDRQVAEYPQEKVHVMTDRDVYCGGDTIWMRIFVVDGTTHRPLSISKYAYANRYLFEVGGTRKSFSQIADIPDSFVAADDLEVGTGNKIPLWLFGFLY